MKFIAPAIPNVEDKNLRRFLIDLCNNIAQSLQSGAAKDEAVQEVLLASPNKTIYAVRVGDDGTLSTTLVQSA